MKALLLVDVQNDFAPGGALAVPEGDQIVEPLNEMMDLFPLVVATQDLHPEDHVSFAKNHEGGEVGKVVQIDGLDQVLWPVHCVANTEGADFIPGLRVGRIKKIIHKGTDQDLDAYSGFFDNGKRKATGLSDYLKGEGVDEIFVGGLATDYCVKFTVLDALSEGFKVVLLTDAVRGIDLNSGDVDAALNEMASKGAQLITAAEAQKGH